MPETLTWLHLSDLHACKPRTGWDAKRVTDTLCADLKRMQARHGLRPDMIFFTGDAAYGQIGKSRGEAIMDQFREAHDFLTAVREAFHPTIDQRNVFLVPGNHDVNRDRITSFETLWLDQPHTLDDITRVVQQAGGDWQRLLSRLDDYAHFLASHGYDHLLTSREHLIYADAREVGGLRVGIAGFNSAWSSRGAGRAEMGRLWMAGRFQLETLRQKMPPHDFAIALVHHPSNWLVPEENPRFGRELARDFPFVLHGHEHQEFVQPDATTGHTVISAGACHEWSESKNNGYNVVRLDLESASGEVWLREYESMGGGWRPRVITGRTDDLGRWELGHLSPWLGPLTRSRSDKREPRSPGIAESADDESGSATDEVDADPAIDYETRYRKSVADRLDYIQLFGIDVPKESKEYSLTVAYVSLNLSDEDEEDLEAETDDEQDDTGPIILPAEEVFDGLRPSAGRLLIRGAAGCGKTTLLRWAAVQAGKAGVKGSVRSDADDWRSRMPFISRLRDCPDGHLPRPNAFPLLLAKELPDPPADWIDEVLQGGRGLVMLDGADEVPPRVRGEMFREIRQLIQTYPDNYYVVTTRPEAVERREFRELGFVSARVQPMAPHDRDTFIDRWHEAMEARLRNWNEPADLRPLAKRLKRRLAETPAIARLTINPLLCAAVCALHRERHENLPETPVELCDKLCEMLLYRRDKERPGLDAQKNIDAAYAHLDFRIRKGLLSKLAHHMVMSGVSAIDEGEADEQIAEALQRYHLTDVNSADVRRALVEHSGLLQESSEQRIEFLHNTLKEFLAAERFVNMGDFQIMAEHAHEPSWQPVILFAVALPRDGSSFATDLVRAIREQTPLDAPPKGRSKQAREHAANIRARQFFFFRCFTNAYQLDDPDIAMAYEKISAHLLPPQTMMDAEALAACGEAMIPHLANRDGLRANERAACVRALGLIGGVRARSRLEAYFNDTTETVNRELMHLVDDALTMPYVIQYIQRLGKVPFGIRRKVTDLAPLATLTNLTSLDLGSTKVNDVSPLAALINLTSLDLGSTNVRDVSPLAALINLKSLDLGSTKVNDVSPLAALTNLTLLSLGFTNVSDVSPLAALTNL
ncbi:leucine-rich repeat domain-containing protein, partial [Candidatus Entotheonella palauensis]|uniref:leucine-rich repeat domain-containing protein n=1 Tax=Candidatus Entotheonella palauensis TaxID=93172 RepID=UPI000B7E97B7